MLDRRNPWTRAIASVLSLSLAWSSVDAAVVSGRAAAASRHSGRAPSSPLKIDLPPVAPALALQAIQPDGLFTPAPATPGQIPLLPRAAFAPAAGVARPQTPGAAPPSTERALAAASAALEAADRRASKSETDDSRQALDQLFEAQAPRKPAASVSPRLGRRLGRWVAAAALGVTLLLGAGPQARAQDGWNALPPSTIQSNKASGAAQTAKTARSVSLKAALAASIYKVADPIRITLHVSNTFSTPLVVPLDRLRASVESAAGPGFAATLPGGKDGELLVAPGATIAVELDLEATAMPAGLEPGKPVKIQVGPASVAHDGTLIEVQPFSFTIESSFAANQPAPTQLAQTKPWSERYYWDKIILAQWLAGLGAGAAAWYLLRRWRKARASRPVKAPDPVDIVNKALRDLEKAKDLSPQEFYRRLIITLNYFLGRIYGLEATPKEDLAAASRTLRNLIALIEARAAEQPEGRALYDKIRQDLEKVAAEADKVLYAQTGVGDHAAGLAAARAVIEAFKPKEEPKPAARKRGRAAAGLALFSASYAQPAWLLLLIPLAAWVVWKLYRAWRGHVSPAIAVPSSALAGKGGENKWRRRLGWLPQGLRVAALALIIAAVADPMWGFRRGDRVVTSLDNIIVVDRSGSMEEEMDEGGTKLDAAKNAARLFIEKQRETTNRIGLIVFHDEARLVMSLTLDYDALASAFDAVQVDGGTNVGNAIDEALTHFLEINIVDLDGKVPGASAVRETLKKSGLAAALDEARKNPRLLDAILAKDQNRVIIFLSDGSGGDPLPAIRRAKDLGVRIFAIGVPGSDDPETLKAMADGTKGQLFWIQNKQDLDKAFLEIDRLEKAWVQTTSPPKPIHRDREVATWALMAVLLSLLLSSGRMRLGRIPSAAAGLVFLPLAFGSPDMNNGALPLLAQAAPQAQKTTQARGALADRLPYREIPAMRDGVRFLNDGKYKEALERFDKAAVDNPQYPEVELFRAMAHNAMKNPQGAEQAMERAVKLARVQGRSDVLAAAQLEMGNAAAKAGDPEKAMQHYRNALRVPQSGVPGQDSRLAETRDKARRNFEQLLRQKPPPSSQQQQQGGGNDGQGKDGKQQQGKDSKEKKPGQDKDGKDEKKDQGKEKQQSQGKDGKDKKKQQQDKQQKGQGKDQKKKPAEPKTGEQESKPQKPTDEKGDRAVKEISKRKKEGPGGSGSYGRGRIWGAGMLGLTGLGQAFSDTVANVSLIWTNPFYLLLAAVTLPILAFLIWRRVANQHRGVRALAPGKTPKRAFDWLPGRRYLRKTMLALAAAALLAGAAAGPSLGKHEESLTFGGQDVVVLQDVSLSVLWAEDGRYEQSTKGLERFLAWLENGSATDRVAVVPFAERTGESVLSDDYKNALFQLYHLGEDALYLPEGSDLGRGVIEALNTFEAARDIGPRRRTMIIMSDGGESSQSSVDLSEAADYARRYNVTIYAIGLGKGGSRMRVPEAMREEVGSEYVMDGGSPAAAGVNEGGLQQLARSTGGLYMRAGEGEAIDQILARIAQREKGKQGALAQVDNSQSRFFLFPAGALLALSLLLGERRKKESAKKDSGSAAKPGRGRSLGALAFLGLPFSIGPAIGLWPAVAVGLVAAALLFAAWYVGRRPTLDPEQEPLDADARRASVEHAATKLRWDKILRGEFRSPEAVRFGADPDDAVPHTDEPWRQIDHRVSARMGQLYARRFEDDPDIPMMVVVDVSRSALQSSRRMSKRDVAADVAGAIALAGARENMSVGLILVSDHVEKMIPPQRGMSHARRILSEISTHEPQGVKTNLTEGLRQALARMPKRGVVVVASDFEDSGYKDTLTAAAGKHIVIPVVLEDAIERSLPVDGAEIEVEDPETAEKGLLDLSASSASRHLIEASLMERHRRLTSALSTISARPLTVINDDNHLNRLMTYFRNGGRIDEPN